MANGLGFAIEIDRKALDGVLAFGGSLGRPLKVGVKRVQIHMGNELQRLIKRRTGRQARGYQPRASADTDYKLTNTKTSAESLLTNKVIYARIQNYGGIVRMADKMLAIPLKAAKTAAGVARLKSPRQDPELKLIFRGRGAKKTLFLGKRPFRRTGGSSRSGGQTFAQMRKVKLFYVLKEQVIVPPTGNVEKAVEDGRRQAERLVGDAIGEEILRLGMN